LQILPPDAISKAFQQLLDVLTMVEEHTQTGCHASICKLANKPNQYICHTVCKVRHAAHGQVVSLIVTERPPLLVAPPMPRGRGHSQNA